MHDLVDIHRAAIAKAGVTLAAAIAEATAEYSASVAASEAALQVAMDRRIEAFHGTGLGLPAPEQGETKPQDRDTIEGQTEAGG